MRKSLYKTKYNITEQQYTNMLFRQNNKCAICDKSEYKRNKDGSIKALAIDHCHKTGEVRGLLCHKCNKAIGLFNDNVELLYAALVYLDSSR